MKKFTLILLTFVITQFSNAADYVQTAEQGLTLRSDSELIPALQKAAREMGSKHELVVSSILVLDVSAKEAGTLDAVSVHFEVRNMQLAEDEDGATLHCEGSLDLVDYQWQFQGGCHH